MSRANTLKAVGKRIKRLREERRFSQRELSEPGITYAYISRIEGALVGPPRRHFGCSPPSSA
jgi:transcriptional regulator with XRE-family HTH domain